MTLEREREVERERKREKGEGGGKSAGEYHNYMLTSGL